jgi:hypothetical protein
MKRIFTALALVAFSVVACGDDDDGNDNTGGNAGTGATSSDAGEPANPVGGNDGTGATGGAPPTMNVACDPEVEGVCQNARDCPLVESGQARQVAGTCGLSCLISSPEDPECPVDCMLVEEELDMSSECADCYGDAAMCGIMECAAPCMAPESADCQECLMESGCRETFNECSGLEQ